jgi:hypothetical protein
LNPVNVSAKCTPWSAAIRPSSADDTSVVTTNRSSPDVWVRMWSASSHPISSPPRRRHVPSGCGMAAPSRSASGSLASASCAPSRPASASSRSIAPGSSGFGKATVVKSGSGSNCSATTAGSSKPAAVNARSNVAPPTPCIGVYTTFTPATSGRSRTAGIVAT